MKKYITFIFLPLIIFCQGQEKIDLLKLNLNESIESIINFSDKKMIGVDTVEYPFCLLLEIDKSSKYSFEGIDLKGQKVFLQVNSEVMKTDSITRFGGGHFDMQSFKDEGELEAVLKTYKADHSVYGYRIEMKTAVLEKEILKKLESKYGKGIRNTNTENGLYWNIKKENKYIFYAPDYDRLIVLNTSHLSKTCYWDSMNGLIDFGGCDNEKYTKELTKNRTDPKDIKNKPVLKIDNNWNINGLILGKSNEADFLKSTANKNAEKMIKLNEKGNEQEMIYQNNYNDLYFYFTAGRKASDAVLKGYSLTDFDRVDISFDNGLKKGTKLENVLKVIDKSQIVNYNELKYSNYLEIKNSTYKINLIFNDGVFSSMYVLKKD
jgi:hypothetical protein